MNSAISSAKPGDVIIMKDGIWHDAVIDFSSLASPSAPITLRAQSPGKVILNGNSRLTFLKPYLIADGLFFDNGALTRAQSSISTKISLCNDGLYRPSKNSPAINAGIKSAFHPLTPDEVGPDWIIKLRNAGGKF